MRVKSISLIFKSLGVRVWLCASLMVVCSLEWHNVYCQTKWKALESGTDKDLHGVVFGNGLFVAVGDEGTIVTSKNGKDWKKQIPLNPNTLFKVIYGKGMFVAVGDNSILTSNNGAEWVSQQFNSDAKYLREIAFGNGNFVVIGGYNGLLTSTNGTDWMERTLPSNTFLVSVVFDNGQFIVSGDQGETYASADGVIWHNLSADSNLSTPDSTSLGRKNWLASTVGSTIDLRYGNRMPSEKRKFPAMRLGDHSDNLIAVGLEGSIWRSSNAKDWEYEPTQTKNVLYDVSFGMDQYIVVGENGVIFASKKDLPSKIVNFSGEVLKQEAKLNWNTDQGKDAQQFEIQKSIDGINYQAIGWVEGKGKDFSFTDALFSSKAYYRVKSSTTTSLTEAILLSFGENNYKAVTVFPNPSIDGKFYLNMPENPFKMSVIAPNGRAILDSVNPSSRVVDLSGFPSGIYFLHVRTGAGVQVLKLAKP